MSTQTVKRRLAGLAAVALLAGGGMLAASATAVAQPSGTPAKAGLVHKAPPQAFVVDGVRYQPEQIAKFNGRQLFFVVDMAKPREMVGYTNSSDAEAMARSIAAKAAGGVGIQQANQYATLYSGDELTGDSYHVYSPFGINYLAGVNRGCGLFGCAGTWDNVASSIYINGRVSVYDDIEYRGAWLYLAGVGYGNFSWWGFDNITSSINVWW